MSAEIENASLTRIMQTIENEKRIWVNSNAALLQQKISIRFKNLSIEEGFRRILVNINHVLVFEQERGLVGLFILGKKDPGKRSPRDVGVVPGKSPPSQPVEEAAVSRDPFEVFPGTDHAGNAKTRSTDRTIGKDSSPLADRDTQIGDKPFTHRSSVPESPFGENAAASPENPFAESVTPSSENPFADPFGAFRDPQRTRIGEN